MAKDGAVVVNERSPSIADLVSVLRAYKGVLQRQGWAEPRDPVPAKKRPTEG